jgi:heme exporter protein B
MGGIGAALSVGARKGGALLALIVLPLLIPVLIFAVAAVEAQIAGLSPRPHLFLLAGLAVFSLTIAPFAMAASLRQAGA